MKKPLSKDLARTFENQGFIVFSTNINDKIYRHGVPRRSALARGPFEIKCAKNEWGSLQIGIWAMEPMTGFSFVVSDLVHENNRDVIPGSGDHMRRYVVFNALVKEKRSKEVTADMDIDPERSAEEDLAGFREEPVVLMDLPGVNIPADTAQAVRVEVYVDRHTVPGVYKGEITFTGSGENEAKMQKVPVTLTVLPFELDEASNWARGAYISKFLDEKELINLKEHGHNQVSWWTAGGYQIKLDEENRVTADFSPYVDYLARLDRAGMTGPHVVFLGGDSPKLHNRIFKLLGRQGIFNGRNRKYRDQYTASDLSAPFESSLIQTLQQFQEQMAASGHENLLCVLLDEPDHRPRPERMDWYNRTYAMVEKNVPELPTMGVFYHEDDEKKLSHHHAVWSTNRPSVPLYNACKKAGKQLFTYHGGFSFHASPGVPRFAVGIIPWVYDAAGTFYWAIWNGEDEQLIEDDIFSPHEFGGQAITISRAPDGADYGPLSTLVHKGFREAVNDARYIKTLEKTIAAAMGTSREVRAMHHKHWLNQIQTTLRRRMVVRGGHVRNHKKWVGFIPPLSSVVFQKMNGQTCGMERLDAFSDCLRQEVGHRIMDLLPHSGPEPGS